MTAIFFSTGFNSIKGLDADAFWRMSIRQKERGDRGRWNEPHARRWSRHRYPQFRFKEEGAGEEERRRAETTGLLHPPFTHWLRNLEHLAFSSFRRYAESHQRNAHVSSSPRAMTFTLKAIHPCSGSQIARWPSSWRCLTIWMSSECE